MIEHAHRSRSDLAAMIGRPPEATTMQVIAVTFRRGEGCCEDDPVRLVTAYYSLEGEVLAERDSLARPPVTVDSIA